MNLVTIDFETYYDKSFSLSKLSTEEYIRDDRFEVLGVGIKFGKKQAVWYAGEAVAPALQAIDWPKYMVIAHNAMFDAAILSWIYDHHPDRWIDTLSLARAIDGLEVSGSLKAAAERHELGVKGEEVIAALGKRLKDFTVEELQRYGEYCKNDCDLTHSLFLLYMEKYGVSVSELVNIDLTIKMFAEPVLELDLPLLEQYLENLKSVKDALLETCGVDGDILRSNPKFAGLLESYDVAVPMKVSPATGKDTYAFAKTDAGLQALLEHQDERVQAAVSARLGIKSSIAETRTQRFIDIAKRGKLPVPLKYYAAHTGRWGGTDKINLQNLPSRGGSTILRQAIRAPEGYLILDCDSAQIEARVLAWLAGQDDLVADFASGRDVYKIMAGVIYSKAPENINDAERFMGKTLVLGCLAEGTLVLCRRGWIPIERITASDQVWDGEEWVCHLGLVNSGCKETLNLCGVWLTPDHRVLSGGQWKRADSVVQDESILCQALDIAAENLPSRGTLLDVVAGSRRSLLNVIVGERNTQSTRITLKISKAPAVIYALRKHLRELGNYIGDTQKFSPTTRTENDYLIDFHRLSGGATPSAIGLLRGMAHGGYSCVMSGVPTGGHFYGMYKQLMGGIIRSTTWIGRITTAVICRGISALSLVGGTCVTEEVSIHCRKKLQTYDIAYCGPRNRYTILSEKGPLIVHNCGYGIGAEKFHRQLAVAGVVTTLENCATNINLYRDTYKAIPRLWSSATRCLKAMMGNKDCELGKYEDAVFLNGEVGFKLPNGYKLNYSELELSDTGEYSYKSRSGRQKIYGGKVVENITQALARCVIAEQMAAISTVYRPVLTVHDAIAVVVPADKIDEAQRFVEHHMSTAPEWAPGLPLACKSKIGETYGG